VGILKLQVLNPPEEFIKGTDSDDNNNSIVLKMNYFKTSFLFTGDLGFEGENELLKGDNISVTVLKVAHHGSARGTSEKLLRFVRPQIAVISSGQGNSYGHPKPALLRRLTSARAKIYRTDLTSTIKIVADKEGFQVYE
jgi:competence protein ComEC